MIETIRRNKIDFASALVLGVIAASVLARVFLVSLHLVT